MKKIFLLAITLFFVSITFACTSFIISGKATPSGKPMMFKHRDKGELNNRISHFQGTQYAFMGLVNSPLLGGEVWAGMNEAGLCIMNTASYNLREDELECAMDREGELMYHVLGQCATINDFEVFLDSYPQPWGVEANFGLIDAHGGAAYYEINNHQWIKYDVNEEANGYRVVTNFSFAGRYEEYEGWERYQTAIAIMQEKFSREKEMTAIDAINYFSRSYRHEVLEINYDENNAPKLVIDQDFIPRRSTSAVICFEGVIPEGKPLHTIMWTALGYPATAVAIPLLMNSKSLPPYMLATSNKAKKTSTLCSEMCNAAMKIKEKYVFPLHISNGHRYLSLQNVLRGAEGRPSLLSCVNEVENHILSQFIPLYQQWADGALVDSVFFKWYDQITKQWMKEYYSVFAPYLTE